MNPAHEIAQTLPEHVPPSHDRLTSVRILRYPHAIPVSYTAVRESVPAMLKSREGIADVILHIGVSAGRKTFDIECCANRRGYVDAQDMSGETMRDERCFEEFNDCEENLSTTLDVDEVLSLWLDELRISSGSGQDVTLRRSSNAGGYLCEYILYNSLAWFARRDRAQGSAAHCNRPVLFLHVPAWLAEDAEVGRKVTIALLRAIAHSWSISRRYAMLSEG